MPNLNQIRTLSQSIQHSDPRLYAILRSIIDNLEELQEEPEAASTAPTLEFTESIEPPSGLTVTVEPDGIRVQLEPVDTAIEYEVRTVLGASIDWNTANFEARIFNEDVKLLPRVSGGYSILVKSIDSSGRFSQNTAISAFVISNPDAPILSSRIVVNSVQILFAVEVTSFGIADYRVYRNNAHYGFTAGSTFASFLESSGGEYTYAVEAIDIAGNISGRNSITVRLDSPTDLHIIKDNSYNLLDAQKKDTNFGHHYDPTLKALIPNIRIHTVNEKLMAYATIQDFINGQTYFLMPSDYNNPNYIELPVVDLEEVFFNVSLRTVHDIEPLLGEINATYMLKHSENLNDIDARALVSIVDLSIARVRYLKLFLKLTSMDNEAFGCLKSLRLIAETHFTTDNGVVDVDENDADGTAVNFNVDYRAVISIECTAEGSTSVVATYQAVDADSFRAFLFNSAGVRVSGRMSWISRGVI